MAGRNKLPDLEKIKRAIARLNARLHSDMLEAEAEQEIEIPSFRMRGRPRQSAKAAAQTTREMLNIELDRYSEFCETQGVEKEDWTEFEDPTTFGLEVLVSRKLRQFKQLDRTKSLAQKKLQAALAMDDKVEWSGRGRRPFSKAKRIAIAAAKLDGANKRIAEEEAKLTEIDKLQREADLLFDEMMLLRIRANEGDEAASQALERLKRVMRSKRQELRSHRKNPAVVKALVETEADKLAAKKRMLEKQRCKIVEEINRLEMELKQI